MKTLNISRPERLGSVALGTAIGSAGIISFKKRPFTSLVKICLGIFLIRRGVMGHCDINQSLGINTAGLSIGDAIRIYASLNKSTDGVGKDFPTQTY